MIRFLKIALGIALLYFAYRMVRLLPDIRGTDGAFLIVAVFLLLIVGVIVLAQGVENCS